jgi:superfamily II DNA/RNA helicase
LGKGHDFQTLLTLFSPRSKEKSAIMPDEPGEIDILIATDCISEGQNLQDCDFLVNYDIHWNPVRIIQRFGRIDRIGSPTRRSSWPTTGQTSRWMNISS